MEFLINFLIIAAVLVLFVNGIVEAIKKVLKGKKLYTKYKPYLPLVSIASGLLVAGVFYPFPFHGFDLYTMLVTGFVAGLSAAGVFDITKAIKGISTGKRDGSNG